MTQQKPTYPAFDEAAFQELQAAFDQSVQIFAGIDLSHTEERYIGIYKPLPGKIFNLFASKKDKQLNEYIIKEKKNGFIPYPTAEDLYSNTNPDKRLNKIEIKNEGEIGSSWLQGTPQEEAAPALHL